MCPQIPIKKINLSLILSPNPGGRDYKSASGILQASLSSWMSEDSESQASECHNCPSHPQPSVLIVLTRSLSPHQSPDPSFSLLASGPSSLPLTAGPLVILMEFDFYARTSSTCNFRFFLLSLFPKSLWQRTIKPGY